jgi:putative ABC transport system ATP-binding protein
MGEPAPGSSFRNIPLERTEVRKTFKSVYNRRSDRLRQWAFHLLQERPMPIIETRNLTKQFGTGDLAVEVLKGVNLSIEPGEFVALMGPSGSGKSTLMSIIGGIEPPSSGQVLLDGVDISTLDDDQRTLLRRRKIGFVFQAFNLIPTLSALENVALPMELDGVARSAARDRATRALERVEMQHRREHIPSKLSGGEQQRVAIARALAIEPMILLADEPTGNLDSRQSGRVTELLRSLARDSQQTIVMVTHDAQVARAAFRLVKFRDGNIEADLTRDEFSANASVFRVAAGESPTDAA